MTAVATGPILVGQQAIDVGKEKTGTQYTDTVPFGLLFNQKVIKVRVYVYDTLRYRFYLFS